MNFVNNLSLESFLSHDTSCYFDFFILMFVSSGFLKEQTFLFFFFLMIEVNGHNDRDECPENCDTSTVEVFLNFVI